MEDRSRTFITLSMLLLGVVLFMKWQEPASSNNTSAPQTVPVAVAANDQPSDDVIVVETDVLKLHISREGGNVVYTELKDYPQKQGSEKGFELLSQTDERFYMAESGFVSNYGPDYKDNTRAKWNVSKKSWQLARGENEMQVTMSYRGSNNVVFKKVFTFKRGAYDIGVDYVINNQSSTNFEGKFYSQVRRVLKTPLPSGLENMNMYTGGAMYTPDKPYTKVPFKDMEKSPVQKSVKGGWAAMSERYFLAAWIPAPKVTHDYFARGSNNSYAIGSVSPKVVVPAGKTETVGATLYVGPEKNDLLAPLSEGLELTVDYGILWPLCKVLYWVMSKVYSVVQNWGLAIISVTLLLKLLFYKLNHKAFYSTAKLKKIQPRLNQIKQMYGNDKQKLSAETMKVFQQEKVNPLSGCLPLLVQIPVFIALYFMLLESVELRQAPLGLWITDLASKDPYYVLPIIVGVTMFIQQLLNPPAQDPVQQKVMMFMPFMFTLLFINFPAGLMLYWATNQSLTILQQYMVNQSMKKMRG